MSAIGYVVISVNTGSGWGVLESGKTAKRLSFSDEAGRKRVIALGRDIAARWQERYSQLRDASFRVEVFDKLESGAHSSAVTSGPAYPATRYAVDYEAHGFRDNGQRYDTEPAAIVARDAARASGYHDASIVTLKAGE